MNFIRHKLHFSMNRLGGEASPYLRQHRNNPVHWYPWGEEALSAAKALDRPIFLSIGYSTCHWCHVMERESFASESTAELLNNYFVSIKVDREERPDIDRTYMTYVQATTGQGGWPLSVFLLADGRPFLGGTYFPPHSQYGRPGFPDLLKLVSRLWERERVKLTQAAEQGHRLLEMVAQKPRDSRDAVSKNAVVEGAFSTVSTVLRDAVGAFELDPIHGGLGSPSGPKFPCAPSLLFLQRAGIAIDHTLLCMAKGGIHDQLEGGFHRYSVDGRWLVPHFEKMLYDQALMLQLYSHTKLTWVVEGIVSYVTKHLSHPAGAFYAAEDADSLVGDQKEEGGWCVWTAQEIRDALAAFPADQVNAFMQTYGVTAQGNYEHGKNILHLIEDAPKYPELRDALLAARNARARPSRDEKIIASWNGWWLQAISHAALIYQNPTWLEMAKKLACFIKEKMVKDGKLLRCWYPEGGREIYGFAEDYAAVIAGLLQLSQSVLRLERKADSEFISFAAELQAIMDAQYWRDGSYVTSQLVTSLRDDYDGAEPSANGQAFLNQVRWRQLGHGNRALEMLQWYQSLMESDPKGCPMAWWAWLEMEQGVMVTVPSTDWIPPEASASVWFCLGDTAHVCTGTSCGPVIADAESLKLQFTDL